MPKQMSLENELETLREATATNPDQLRQYVTRVTVGTAEQFIADCIDHDQQPAQRLREIIEQYYSGQIIHMDAVVAEFVNRIAVIKGKSPNDMVKLLLVKFGVQELQSLSQKSA